MSPDPFAILSVVLWIAAAPRLRDLGPGASPSRRSVAVAIAALAVVTTAFAEVPGRAINDVSGIDYLNDVTGRGALMVAAVAAQCIFLTLSPTPGPDAAHSRTRAPQGTAVRSRPLSGSGVGRRILVLLLALALLVSAFTVAVTTLPLVPGQDFLVDLSDEPPLTVYTLTFIALLGWCFLDLVRAWWRLRHRVTGPLRTGLALLAAGAMAGLGYVVLRVLGVAADLAPWPGITAPVTLGSLVMGTATASLVTAGISWHSLAGGFTRAHQWIVARRRLIALGPLWRDLVATVPDIALQRPSRWEAVTDRVKVTGVAWRVYRRVIEICDASLALHRRDRTRRRGGTQTAPRAPGLEATVGRVLEELDPRQPTDADGNPRLYAAVSQEAQIERLVDIAEDHAHGRTILTHSRTHRDQDEDSE